MADKTTLTLPDDCRVRAIRSVHDEMTKSLAAARHVEIDGTGVVLCDIALVQLVISAAQTARRTGKQIRLVNPSAEVAATFARAGLPLDGPHADPFNF
ncbi:STAS domain-containing protein [Methylobacterium sp. ID0610]|uniref:STAS domain-containing protein n=1 Tax=Methylobacterium carpenticola TaxID=3344827 RepID=UPI0036CF2664